MRRGHRAAGDARASQCSIRRRRALHPARHSRPATSSPRGRDAVNAPEQVAEKIEARARRPQIRAAAPSRATAPTSSRDPDRAAETGRQTKRTVISDARSSFIGVCRLEPADPRAQLTRHGSGSEGRTIAQRLLRTASRDAAQDRSCSAVAGSGRGPVTSTYGAAMLDEIRAPAAR